MKNYLTLASVAVGTVFLTTACSITVGGLPPMGPGVNVTSSTTKDINFVADAPTYNIYKVKLNVDFADQKQAKTIRIENTPAHLLNIYSQAEAKQSQGSAVAYVASKKELSSNRILEISAQSFGDTSEDANEDVRYSGKSSSLPVCDGMMTGYIYKSKKNNSKETKTLKVNMMNNDKDLCLLMGEIVVPSEGDFNLEINGDAVIDSKMAPSDHADAIQIWGRKNIDRAKRDRRLGFAYGIDRFLRAL